MSRIGARSSLRTVRTKWPSSRKGSAWASGSSWTGSGRSAMVTRSTSRVGSAHRPPRAADRSVGGAHPTGTPSGGRGSAAPGAELENVRTSICDGKKCSLVIWMQGSPSDAAASHSVWSRTDRDETCTPGFARRRVVGVARHTESGRQASDGGYMDLRIRTVSNGTCTLRFGLMSGHRWSKNSHRRLSAGLRGPPSTASPAPGHGGAWPRTWNACRRNDLGRGLARTTLGAGAGRAPGRGPGCQPGAT